MIVDKYTAIHTKPKTEENDCLYVMGIYLINYSLNT